MVTQTDDTNVVIHIYVKWITQLLRVLLLQLILVFVLFRGYAEMVERRLKSVGLVVELHFHGTQPISELLDDVARRGVLYAIVITSQHEIHRSVTVNILHGTPQGKEQKPLARIKKHTGKRYIGEQGCHKEPVASRFTVLSHHCVPPTSAWECRNRICGLDAHYNLYSPTIPLRSKLPVVSCFLRNANGIARVLHDSHNPRVTEVKIFGVNFGWLHYVRSVNFAYRFREVLNNCSCFAAEIQAVDTCTRSSLLGQCNRSHLEVKSSVPNITNLIVNDCCSSIIVANDCCSVYPARCPS